MHGFELKLKIEVTPIRSKNLMMSKNSKMKVKSDQSLNEKSKSLKSRKPLFGKNSLLQNKFHSIKTYGADVSTKIKNIENILEKLKAGRLKLKGRLSQFTIV